MVVDLRGFTIDLRSAPGQNSGRNLSETTAIGEAFYPLLQARLNPAKAVNGSASVGLDLSDALIQGDLWLSRLGLRIPAYGGARLPALEAFNTEFQPSQTAEQVRWRSPAAGRSRGSLTDLSSDRTASNFGSTPAALAKFLMTPAQPAQLESVVWQGPLLLRNTCFSGAVKANTLYFLDRVDASGAIFTQLANWQGVKFARDALFERAQFQQESNFRGVLFAQRSQFNQAQFNGISNWQGSHFYGASSFAQASFKAVTFARAHWLMNADFDQSVLREVSNFQKSRFDQALFLTDAQLESAVNFRQAQFQRSISLRGAHILGLLDFGDARFSTEATVNVADLDFSAATAQVLGSPGQIGKRFLLPTLSSNETVLRNLVRNFRQLEQIEDANQLEYTTERLRLAKIRRQVFGLGVNQASPAQLVALGLSEEQALAVTQRAAEQPFVGRSDLLSLEAIDLATYLKVRDSHHHSPNDCI